MNELLSMAISVGNRSLSVKTHLFRLLKLAALDAIPWRICLPLTGAGRTR